MYHKNFTSLYNISILQIIDEYSQVSFEFHFDYFPSLN